MLERRRIFTSRRNRYRLREATIMLVLVAPLLALLLFGPSAYLLGSAPHERQWVADAPEIRIIDGETLLLGGRVVRLAGLAAPARGEICETPAGGGLDCGVEAAAALQRLLAGRAVSCRIVGRDGFGRGVGLCESAGIDLASRLVSAGFALATDAALVPLEREAREARRGLWGEVASPPPAWRGRS